MRSKFAAKQSGVCLDAPENKRMIVCKNVQIVLTNQKSSRLSACKISGKMKLATTFFVVAF